MPGIHAQDDEPSADGFGMDVMTNEVDDEAPAPLGAPTVGSASEPWTTRAWASPWWAHLLVLAALTVGVAIFATSSGIQVADDGSYQLQLQALAEGDWTYEAGTERFDPDGSHYPITKAQGGPTEFSPSAKRPAWAWLANAVAPITGVGRAYATLGIVSVLVLAGAAWAIAGRHDPRWSRSAFWVAGTAPVAIAAGVPWAHAAGAACAGVALLGIVWLGEGRRPVLAGACAALGAAGAILVRAEGLILAAAVVVGLVVALARGGRRWSVALGSGAVLGAWVVVVAWAEAAWTRAIVGASITSLSAREGSAIADSFIQARLHGALRSMIDGPSPSRNIALIAIVAITAGCAWAVAAGHHRLVVAWQAAVLLSLVLLAERVRWLQDFPVNGILTTWPILVTGLAAIAAVAWRRLPVELVVAGVYVAGVLASQYPDGGAGSWGARFLALGTVPLAVLAVAGAHRLAERAPSRPDGLITVPRVLVASVIVPFVLGVMVTARVHQSTDEQFSWTAAQIEGIAVTPAVELPRMMWRHDVDWLVVDDTRTTDDLVEVLAALEAGGEDQASLVLLDEHLDDADDAIAQSGTWVETSREDFEELTVVGVVRRPAGS